MRQQHQTLGSLGYRLVGFGVDDLDQELIGQGVVKTVAGRTFDEPALHLGHAVGAADHGIARAQGDQPFDQIAPRLGVKRLAGHKDHADGGKVRVHGLRRLQETADEGGNAPEKGRAAALDDAHGLLGRIAEGEVGRRIAGQGCYDRNVHHRRSLLRPGEGAVGAPRQRKEIGDDVVRAHAAEQQHVPVEQEDVEEIEAGRNEGRGHPARRAGRVHHVPDRLHFLVETLALKHEIVGVVHQVLLRRDRQFGQIRKRPEIRADEPALGHQCPVERMAVGDEIHRALEIPLACGLNLCTRPSKGGR